MASRKPKKPRARVSDPARWTAKPGAGQVSDETLRPLALLLWERVKRRREKR